MYEQEYFISNSHIVEFVIAEEEIQQTVLFIETIEETMNKKINLIKKEIALCKKEPNTIAHNCPDWGDITNADILDGLESVELAVWESNKASSFLLSTVLLLSMTERIFNVICDYQNIKVSKKTKGVSKITNMLHSLSPELILEIEDFEKNRTSLVKARNAFIHGDWQSEELRKESTYIKSCNETYLNSLTSYLEQLEDTFYPEKPE